MQCDCKYDYYEQEGGIHYHPAENIFMAFDRATGLMRYDYIELPNSGLPNQTIVRPDIVLSVPASWKQGGSSHPRSMLRELPTGAGETLERFRDPFATVIAGCAANRLAHVNTTFLNRFLDINVLDSSITSCELIDSSRVQFALRYKSAKLKDTVEYELTLDSTRGYVPVRVTIRHNATKTGDWTPRDVIDTDWEAANGVYVPTRIHCSGTFYVKSDIKLLLDWEHVNEMLDTLLFSDEAFSLKRGDLIVAAQGDQLTVEKIVGVELPTLPKKQPDPPPRYWRFAMIMLANAIGIGGMLYFFRQRDRAVERGRSKEL